MAATIVVVLVGVRSLRRPIDDDEQYRSAQWDGRLLLVVGASAAILLGFALLGLLWWFADGVVHGVGG